MPRDVKFRKTLTPTQRFERALEKSPGIDPVFPVLMHSLERYLDGATDQSAIDDIVRKHLNRRPAITDEIVRGWIKNWRELPEETKAKFVPQELRSLSSSRKLDTEGFRKVVSQTYEPHPFIMAGGLMARTIRGYVPKLHRLNISAAQASTISIFKTKGIIIKPTVTQPGATISAITPIEPDGYPWIYWGEPFTIYGDGFASNKADNNIIIASQAGDMLGQVVPVTATQTKLEAVAPNLTTECEGAIFVTVTGKSASNVVQAHFQPSPAEAPTIDSINPGSGFPGDKVLVTGHGFGNNPRVIWESMDPTQPQTIPIYDDVQMLQAGTQVQMTVPEWITPGQYRVAFYSPNQLLSLWKVFSVNPFKFRVEFQQMECLDESDPEWVGDDELVTKWVIAADNQVWQKSTGEYSGFEDGTVQNYNAADRVVFVPGDAGGIVTNSLYISTAAWEWDEGDAQAANEILGYIGDLATAIGGFIGGVGATVGAIVAGILKALGKLISWLGGDPDALGVVDTVWSYTDLRQKTKNPTKSFTGQLDFINDDDTGSYRLKYVVFRE